MRIISGKYKGRRISPPNNITARPTTDFAKEGLFNLLNNRIEIEDATCLDLFSGTGSISFELLSRYCKSISTVEKSESHCAFIRKTCASLGIDNMQLIKGDVIVFLKRTSACYDLIFADPPYDFELLESLPDLVFSKNRLNPDGIFVLEHSKKNNFEDHPNFVDHRRYGNVNFSFFQDKTPQESRTSLVEKLKE